MMSKNVKEMDPVCGMEVEVKESTPTTSINGKDYFFCCTGCLKSFEKDPTKYLEQKHEMHNNGHHGHHGHHH